jgi:methyltransferase family protein
VAGPAVHAVRVPRGALKQVVACLSPGDRDETAVPSYCHWNPLVRRLFWQRLDAAVTLARLEPGERVFDYGVGSGVLLATYQRVAGSIAGTDLHIQPARTMARRLAVDATLLPLDEVPRWSAAHAGAVDCIFALDVLEHVDDADLGRLSLEFRRLLSARGRLVVSGPTETRLYDLARRLSGFQNAYHHRTVYDIDGTLRRDWIPDASLTLPSRPLPRAFVVTRYVPRPA